MNRSRFAIVVVALGALAGDAAAVTTRTFGSATYKEFDEGETEDAIITSLGEVRPGVDTARVDLETDAVWTAVRESDGTIYAGGVTDGKVYKVSGGAKSVFATLGEDSPWIGALALGADGTLYAGTLGTATIHAIDKAGKAKKIVTLEGADHIWALVVDGGKLWAATGPDGKLFSVDVAAGKGSVVWESGEKHLLSMIRARDGALMIGTASEAILYRFDPKATQARALADFAGTEVKGIVEIGGAFVVIANEFDQKTSSPPTPPVTKGPKGTAAKPPAEGPGADKSGEAARPGERKGKGALFRVEPDGRVEQLHSLADSYFQHLAALADGTVYAAAGAQGRVYQVKPDRSIVTAFDVAERQVNAVMAWDGGVAFVTGDSGAAYASKGAAKTGTYTSKVFDAGFPARWGNVRYRATGIVFETRSGNTAKPGKGWSAWQKLTSVTRAAGDASVGRIASPSGRYVQYRARFEGGTAGVLSEVDLYYVPQNQRPRVTDITVGDEGKRPPVTTASGSTKPRSPILKVKWKVENTDEDDLIYKLEYRPEGDAEWRAVPTGEGDYTKTDFDWNTEALPDGYYRVRVTASDARSNPPDVALEHTHIGQPFLVDNLKPQVTNLEVKAPFASGRALDSFSRIDEIAYSVDGKEWTVAYPKDGIFDDVAETFTLSLPRDLAVGSHTLTIRVADEADNIGAASVTFRVTR